MSAPFLTLPNLQNGIAVWRSKCHWPQDFHNNLYNKLIPIWRTPQATSTNDWSEVVNELAKWRVFRGQKGNGKHNILRHGSIPSNLCTALVNLNGQPLPIPISPHQSMVYQMFNQASALRPTSTNSPVFPSKLCHLLHPWEFVVWDNQMIGHKSRQFWSTHLANWSGLNSHQINLLCTHLRANDYWRYRVFLLMAWDTASFCLKQQLISQLNNDILKLNPSATIPPNYPYRTKIPEICLL